MLAGAATAVLLVPATLNLSLLLHLLLLLLQQLLLLLLLLLLLPWLLRLASIPHPVQVLKQPLSPPRVDLPVQRR